MIYLKLKKGVALVMSSHSRALLWLEKRKWSYRWPTPVTIWATISSICKYLSEGLAILTAVHLNGLVTKANGVQNMADIHSKVNANNFRHHYSPVAIGISNGSKTLTIPPSVFSELNVRNLLLLKLVVNAKMNRVLKIKLMPLSKWKSLFGCFF